MLSSFNILLLFCSVRLHTSIPNTSVACIYYSEGIKSNQITFIVTSPQHMCRWVKFLSACSRQCRNNLHMDSTYLQTVQKTMCKIHIHILSTHSVLLDILTLSNTHYTPYVHILHYVHLYTQCYAKKIIII